MRSEYELDREENEMNERMAEYEGKQAIKRLEWMSEIDRMIEEARIA